jgi:hypothetical protein
MTTPADASPRPAFAARLIVLQSSAKRAMIYGFVRVTLSRFVI